MAVVLTIDVLVLFGLFGIALLRGLEAALPFATFVLVLVPHQSLIALPAFGLTTQRVVVVSLSILYVILHRRNNDGARFADASIRWLMLAQVAWALLSTAHSIVPSISFKKLLSEAIEYYLLYLIFTRTITQANTIRRLLYAMVSAIIVCSFFGGVQAYTGWAVTSLFPVEMDVTTVIGGAGPTARGLRVWSTFPHPILFGVAIAIVLPVTLYLLSTAKNPIRKAWLWAGIMLMFLSIYKTSSRGPWLAAILGSAVIFFFGPRRIRVYLLGIAMLSAAVMITRPGVWQTLADDYTQTITPTSPLGKSYQYRYALRHVAQDAVNASLSHSLWGYGMGSFFYLNLESYFDGRMYKFQSCDSTWIEFMVETGYVGLLLMVLLLFRSVMIPWFDFRRLPRPEKYVSLVLFIAIAAYYFAMLSVSLYSWGQEGYMLWVMIASAVSYNRLFPQKTPAQGLSNRNHTNPYQDTKPDRQPMHEYV